MTAIFLTVRNAPARPFLVALLISGLLVQPIGSGPLLLPRAVFAQSVPIPSLAQWASNMVTYGQQNCSRLANESVNYYLTHTAGTNDDNYYDAERVFYQIADYTGNSAPWNSCAHVAQGIYRDQFVIPNLQNGYNGTAVPGYTVFTTGLRMDYQRTGDVVSQNAVFLLSLNAAYAPDNTPLSNTTSADRSREVAYAILSYINAQALGQAPRQRRIDLVNQAYGHMNQWFVYFSWPGPWQQSAQTTSRLAPFMVGLTAHTLIRDWEQTKDSRLIPALTLAADWMWANAWIPAAQAFWYDSTNTSNAAPDLNLLIAPIYAFLYWQTGNTKYRDEGDQIFAGGVRLAYLGDGKHFDQNYWWSFDYVKWRGLRQTAIGLFNPATSIFFMRTSNTSGNADLTFSYGPAGAGWIPIVGDWNGSGTKKVGLYDPVTSTFYLRNSNTSGPADVAFTYGAAGAGWIPIAGDWNGTGADKAGLYNPFTSTFYLRNSNTSGPADVVFTYGAAGAGWIPIVGDWNGTGADKVGLYSPVTSTFFLRDSDASGLADVTFGYGPAGARWTPLAGLWADP